MNEEVSCGALIIRDGQVLITKSSAGVWGIPKGHIQEGESLTNCVKREVAEETGIGSLVLLPGFRKRLRWRFCAGGYWVRKTAEYRLARTIQRRIRLSPEHRAGRWCTFEEAQAKLRFPNARALLRSAERFLARTLT